MVNKTIVMTIYPSSGTFKCVDILLDDAENCIKFKMYYDKERKSGSVLDIVPKDFREIVDFLFKYVNWRMDDSMENTIKTEDLKQRLTALLPSENS